MDAGFDIEAGVHVEPLRQVVVDVGTGSVGNGDGSVVVTDNGNVGDGLGDGSNGAIAGANDGLGGGSNAAASAADGIENGRKNEYRSSVYQSIDKIRFI